MKPTATGRFPRIERPVSRKMNGSNPKTDAQRLLRLHCLALHRGFHHQAIGIAVDGSDREYLALAFISQCTVTSRDVTVDRQIVPGIGMAHVVDRDVIVLAPEKRYANELLPPAQHVDGGRLALTLSNDPMFDANRRAAVR